MSEVIIKRRSALRSAYIVAASLVIAGVVVVCTASLLLRNFLPVYPPLVSPQVAVTMQYPGGADAETVAQTVAEPLEQQINGMEDMIYMQSTSNFSGDMRLTVTFRQGTDMDKALVEVYRRAQYASSLMPLEVQHQGFSVQTQEARYLTIADVEAIRAAEPIQ